MSREDFTSERRVRPEPLIADVRHLFATVRRQCVTGHTVFRESKAHTLSENASRRRNITDLRLVGHDDQHTASALK
jgi:hypothetical protein